MSTNPERRGEEGRRRLEAPEAIGEDLEQIGQIARSRRVAALKSHSA